LIYAMPPSLFIELWNVNPRTGRAAIQQGKNLAARHCRQIPSLAWRAIQLAKFTVTQAMAKPNPRKPSKIWGETARIQAA
jgi:hypothetical protein